MFLPLLVPRLIVAGEGQRVAQSRGKREDASVKTPLTFLLKVSATCSDTVLFYLSNGRRCYSGTFSAPGALLLSRFIRQTSLALTNSPRIRVDPCSRDPSRSVRDSIDRNRMRINVISTNHRIQEIKNPRSRRRDALFRWKWGIEI